MSTRLRRLGLAVVFFIVLILGCVFTLNTIPTPGQAATPCEPLASDKGQLSFTVRAEETGTYYLWLRMVEPADDRNSLFVHIDGLCPIATGDGAAAQGLAWVNNRSGTAEPLSFALAAGDHTFIFAGREAKTGLDKFMLLNNKDCIPVDAGDNCLTGPSPTPEAAIKTVARNNLFILILCSVVGLSAVGFLIWRYFKFAKHTLPLLAANNQAIVVGGSNSKNHLAQLRHFVIHHRITVAICMGIIFASTAAGIVFAATNASFEAEAGSVSGTAQIIDNPSASNGKYVLFDTAASDPPQPGSGTGSGSGSGSGSGGGTGSGGGSSGGGGGGSSGGGGSGGGTNPPPSSSDCDPFPDDKCTGYKHTGVTLQACSLPLTQPTYDSCLFTGTATVSAANITVTRSKFVGIIEYKFGDSGSLRGLSLTDVEIDSTGYQGVATIGNNDYTCLRCHVHGGMRGANVGSNVTIKDSYFRDWVYEPGDHITAIGGHGGSNNLIEHNNLSCNILNDPDGYACSSALSVYGDDAPGNDNWTIKNNLFNSASSFCVTISGPPNKTYPFTNMKFTGNTFGSDATAHWGVPASQCTEYGPINTQSSSWSANGNTWTGNVNSQGGTVNP